MHTREYIGGVLPLIRMTSRRLKAARGGWLTGVVVLYQVETVIRDLFIYFMGGSCIFLLLFIAYSVSKE